MAVLPSAKCILGAARRGGGGGGEAPVDSQSLVRVGLFGLCQVRALQLLVDTPPIGTLVRRRGGAGVVSSLAPRFGLFFPRGCGKEVGTVTALPPQGKAN